MSLALETLVWNSDTSALEQAVKQIDNLTDSVKRLSKAQQDETKTAVQAEKLKQEEAKTAAASAKAKEAEAKAEQALTKAKQSSAKVSKEVTDNTDANNKVLQRQKEMLEFMTQGYSRGQASTLAYAKATGAATSEINELGNVLKTQRKLMGSDPFDKSLSGLTALRNQLGEVREAYRQYGDGVELTRNQTRELARDKERIIERLKQEGASFTDIKNAIKAHGEEYIATAAKVNSLINQEKELERQHRESANAARALAAEEERMISIMNSMNHTVDGSSKAGQAAAVSIARYERNLRLAGVGAQEAANKLELYKRQMIQVQEIEQNRKAQHLSRALTPQISDVVTSLAGGMPLHLVIMQQGLQIRDMITLSGVEMGKLQEVFKTASADVIRSLSGTAQAIGTLLIGSIVSAGKALRDGFIAPLKDTNELIKMVFSGNIKSAEDLSRVYQQSGKAISGAFMVIAGVGAAALVALSVAAIQVINATTEMNSSLIQFGAQLGITSSEAKGVASSLTDFGVSYATGLRIVGEFAKSGIKDLGLLTEATQAATYASESLGIDVKELIKQYQDVGEKPVETLIEIAKNNGLVEAATIRNVQALLDQGEAAEANETALRAVIKAQKDMGDAAVANFSPIQRLWRDIKEAFTDAWSEMQKASENSTIFGVLRLALAGVRHFIEQIYYGLLAISNIGAAVLTLQFHKIGGIIDEADQKLRASNARLADTFEDVLSGGERTRQMMEEQAAARKAAAEAGGEIEKQLKRESDARKLLADTAAKGLSDQEQKQLKLNAVHEAYRVAIVGAQGDQQQMNQIVDNYNKSLAAVNAEFDNKTKKTKKASEATKFYNKVIEDFQKLQVKSSGTTDDLSKAQTHLLNVMSDPKWDTLSLREKEEILTQMAKAHAIEEAAEAYDKQKKALESLQKLFDNLKQTNLKWHQEIVLQNKELAFQYSLLGKSDDQIKEMTRNYEMQRKISEIMNKYEQERLKALAEYNKNIKDVTDPAKRLEAERTFNEELKRLGTNRENEIANVRDERQLQSLQDYDAEWKRIQGEVGDAVWVALTEGGRKGAKKVGDFLKEELRKIAMKPINLVVNLVMDTGKALLGMALNFLTGGSSGSGLGSILGLASNAKSAYSLMAIGSDLVRHGASVAYANYAGSITGDPIKALIDAKSVTSWFNDSASQIIGKEIGKAAGTEMASSTSAFTSSWAHYANVAGAALSAYGVGKYFGQKYGVVAGTAMGTLAGVGTYAAGTAMATSTSFAAALGSIPGWGWVAAAVVALVGALSGKKPKMKGDKITAEVSDGAFEVTDTKVLRKSLGEKNVDALTQVASIFANTYNGILEEFGQEASYALSATFRTRTNALASLEVDGVQVAGGKSKKYSMEKFFNDVMTNGIVNAVKMSELPDQIKALFETGVDVDQMGLNIAAIVNMNRALKDLGTDLATFIGDINFDDYRQEGERNVDVISRITLSLLQFNAGLEAIGFKTLDVTYKSYDMVKAMEDAAGGQEKLGEILGKFFDAFASDLDRFKMQADSFYGTLESIIPEDMLEGINLESLTVQGFKDLTESLIHAGTESANAATGLLSMAEAFKEVQNAALNMLSISADSISGIFSSVMSEATSRAEAEEMAREQSIQMFYDGFTGMMINTVGQIVMDNIIAPLATNIVSASAQAATMDVSSSAVAANNLATGGTVAGTVVAQGGQIAGNALAGIVNQAVSVINTMTAVMQNPEFQSAMQQMSITMGQIGGELWQSGSDLRRTTFSGAFRPVTPTVTPTGTTTTERPVDRLKEAYDLLMKVIAKERELTKERLDSISKIYEISINAAKELYKQVDSTRRQSFAEARSFFDESVVGIMQGVMPDADKYKEAVDNLMLEISETAYATKVDADRARLLLANEFQAVADQIEPEKTALEQQLDYLERLEQTAKEQLEAIQNGTQATVTLVQAIAQWQGISGLMLPAFANGGYYSGGMALVGENGPELINFSNPGQVYTANQTASMLSGDNSELLEDLIQEVQMLRAEVRADVSHNAKTAKLLDRVIPDGRTVAVTVTP